MENNDEVIIWLESVWSILKLQREGKAIEWNLVDFNKYYQGIDYGREIKWVLSQDKWESLQIECVIQCLE